MIARVIQLPLRGGQCRFRRALGIQFVFRIEFRDQLTRLDAVADIDRALDHPSADAKGNGDLVLRLNMPGQHHRLVDLGLRDGHGPHRPDFSRRLIGRLARREQNQQGWRNKPSP